LIDRAIFPGMQGGPHMHVIAAKAVSFDEAMQPEFRQYAQSVVDNARTLAEELAARGFNLVTGGTSNHLILADVNKSFGIDGKTAEVALDSIGLTLNANTVPDDPLPPFRPSGIRLGTPALTTRGLTGEHMPQIAEWMLQAIEARDDSDRLAQLRQAVTDFARQFPLPSDI
jgi:glycine hydroxymethyltransferase